MPFKKGDPKPPSSGRKKNSGNKVKSEVRKRVLAAGHDPVLALIDIARDSYAEGELSISLQANRELMTYMYPKLKSVEHSTQQGGISVQWVTGVPSDIGPPFDDPAPTTSGGMTAADLQKLIEGS